YVDVAVSRPGDPTANFTLDSYNCNAETIILLDQTSITTRDSVEHIWLVSHSGITDTLYGESHELDIGMDQDISISYEIITDIGCNDIKLLDTTIVTNDFVVEYEDKIICDGESVVIFSSDLPDITVDISPDTNVQYDGAGTYFIDDFIGEQDFTINVTNGFCFDDSIVNITTAADPTFPLPDLIQCGSATVELNADGPDFYFYEWSGPLITDPNEVNPTVSLLTSETYYVTVSTSEGSLCSFQDSLDVIVSPIPQFEILPAPRIIYCSGDTVTLSLDQTFESVEWTSISGELLGEEDTLLLIDLIESDTISALVTTIDGCQNEETVIIQFVAEPIINFAPETIDTVCQGDDAFLAVVPTSDSITWTDIDGVVLGVGNTLIVPNVQDSQTVINVTSTNILYSCETMRSITINLYPDPVIDFTPLDNITICPGMMIPINIESQDSVIWYDENGDVLAIGSELFLSGIEDTITYAITVINEFGCETSKDFEIIVDPSIVPEVDISILDTVNVCETTDFSVTIESMDSITWYDINGNVLEVGNDFMVQNVTDTTTYIISVIDTFGCELLDTFDLNPYAGINLQIITLSNDTVYCEGESVDIISISNVDATVSWFNADTLIGVGDTLMDYFPIGDVSIVAIAEDMFGCMSSDTFDIRESQTEGEIVGDSLICIDGMADLMFIPEIDTDQFSIAWEPNEYITIDNGLSITVGPPFTTLFTAMYSNEDGCITQDSFFVIVAGFFDPIIAEADPPEILLGNSSQLSTDQDDSFTYNWEPVETLDDPESPTPIATPLETTTYFVTVTDLNGCTGTAEVTVEVIQPNCDESDIFIPNMFTPNGDMLNDFFKVESNFVEEQEVIIYNRWGEEVYKSSDINARWDGTFEGRELPPDVFGYHIWIRCINGLEYMKQGNITLNK
ncbi:MAG: gliding motility-associated C-terminal domain-containing protein, partial [Bacteroidia bacterium]|nr:gliding motility-associated C-terminal domain-containing protein [Bacteroidia bacterium]